MPRRMKIHWGWEVVDYLRDQISEDWNNREESPVLTDSEKGFVLRLSESVMPTFWSLCDEVEDLRIYAPPALRRVRKLAEEVWARLEARERTLLPPSNNVIAFPGEEELSTAVH